MCPTSTAELQAPLFEEKDYAKLDCPHKTIRVAVSGNVVLTHLEVMVIDTPEFQRLRKLRQLGTSYLIYPSANHTRFEHSLGTLKMSEIMMSSIEHNAHNLEHEKSISPQQRRITRLAALLHDVTNLPFGHTLEDETNVIESNQDDYIRVKEFLGPTTDLGKILSTQLSKEDYDLLIDVLTAKESPSENTKKQGVKSIVDLGRNAFIIDIIKNTVCADLLDYLRRDSYFCSVDLTVPDTFLDYLFLNREDSGVYRLAIRLYKKKANEQRHAVISELVQLLESRYFLAERVYFHHAKQISSAMLASAVWHAMHQSKNRLSLNDLKSLGDDELLKKLCEENYNEVTTKLANALCNRKLYKRFFVISKREAEADESRNYLEYFRKTFHSNAVSRTEKEEQIREYAKLDKGDVIIYCPNPDMNLKEAKMRVTSNKGVKPLNEAASDLTREKIDAIIRSHQELWQLQVFVRNEVLLDGSKTELLKAICNYLFLGYDDDDYFKPVIRLIWEQIEKEQNIEIHHRNELMNWCLARRRDGAITRQQIEKHIQEEAEPSASH